MIPISIILFIIVGHFLADFVFQTDDMAKGKSKCNKALTKHVWAYYLTFIFLNGLCIVLGVWAPSGLMLTLWITMNAILHWITDYFTSRKSSKLWAEGRVHDFFVCIGFDQLIHYTTWIVTYYWMFVLWNT